MKQKNVLGHRISPLTISITFDDGNPVSIARDNPSFAKIKTKLEKKDYAGLWDLCRPAEGIKTFFNGGVEVRGGSLFMNGNRLEHAIVPTILQHIRDGLDASHLIRFLQLLEQNPSMNSRNQLWQFIEKNGITIYSGGPVTITHEITAPETTLRSVPPMPVNMQGYLVLYKGVRSDYYDQHSGKFLNKPGTSLSMPRSKVDDNASAACSSGFHAGAFEYVKGFGSRKLIVLVNPKDVVSVPHDCSAQKVRTSVYNVLKEVEASTFAPIQTAVYDNCEDYEIVYLEYEDDEEYETYPVRAEDAEAALGEFNEFGPDAYKIISVNQV